MTVPQEVMSVGSERAGFSARPRAWARRHRLWIVGVLVLMVALGAVDQWQRHREMDALLVQVTSGEQSIDAANGSLQVLVDYYTPVLSRPAGGGVRPAFLTDVAEAAAQGVESTREASAGVASVHVLPWHRDLRAARAEYQARVDRWNSYLAALVDDPDLVFGGAEDTLPSTSRAHDALVSAVPWPPGSVRAQIDALLAP